MPIPVTLNTKVVAGHYLSADGSPGVGSVKFRLKAPIVSLAPINGQHIIVMPKELTATLDAEGKFSITLVHSSDNDFAPATSYVVTEAVNGLTRAAYEITVDETSAAVIDLIVAAPVTAPAVNLSYLTPLAADAVYLRGITVDGTTVTPVNGVVDLTGLGGGGTPDGTIYVQRVNGATPDEDGNVSVVFTVPDYVMYGWSGPEGATPPADLPEGAYVFYELP